MQNLSILINISPASLISRALLFKGDGGNPSTGKKSIQILSEVKKNVQ